MGAHIFVSTHPRTDGDNQSLWTIDVIRTWERVLLCHTKLGVSGEGDDPRETIGEGSWRYVLAAQSAVEGP